MAKDMSAVTGEYTDREGNNKKRYAKIGVIMSNDNGEYALLDPSVNLAGILIQQNAMSGQNRTSVMISIFDNDNRQQRPAAQQQVPPEQRPAQDAFDSSDVPF